MRPKVITALHGLWAFLRGRPPSITSHSQPTRLPSILDGAYFPAVIAFDTAVAISDDQKIRVHQRLKQLAAEASRRHSVLDVDEARASVAERIAYAARSGDIRPGVNGIRVEVHAPDEQTAEVARGRDLIRQKTAVFQEEKEAESYRLRELSTQILGNVDTLRVWWLQEDPARLLDLVKLEKEEVFAKAASMFGGGPADGVHQIADLLQQLFADLNPDQRRLLIMDFLELLRSFDRANVVPQIRETIDSEASLDGHANQQL